MDNRLLDSLRQRYDLARQPDWQDLRVHLDFAGDQFSFIPLILPDAPAAQIAREQLQLDLAEQGRTLFPFFLEPGDNWEAELPGRLPRELPDNCGALWLQPQPEGWSKDFADYEHALWPAFARRFNLLREPLRRRYPLPLFLVGSRLLRDALLQFAPDFWSIRALVLHPDPAEPVDDHLFLPTEPGWEGGSLDGDESSGNLPDTLADLERIRDRNPASPLLPKLLKRAGRLEFDQLKWDDARAHLEEALEWEEEHDSHPRHRLETHRWLERLFGQTANYPLALHHAERALALAENHSPPDSPELSVALNNLALLFQATNRLAEAEPLMRSALAIDETSFGKDHPNVARNLNNLAQLLKDTNRPAEAEPLMRRALAIDEASFGKDHPNVAIRLNNLASLLKDTNRLAEAEPLMRSALAFDEASFGKDHPNVARDLNNLAQLFQATNRLAEAEPLMRRALVIDETSFGMDHPNVAIRLNNLAQLLKDTNRLAEAEPLMRRALAIDEASFGKDHPKVAIRLVNLASLLMATGRREEAGPMLERAVKIYSDSLGEEHPNTKIAREWLAIWQAGAE